MVMVMVTGDGYDDDRDRDDDSREPSIVVPCCPCSRRHCAGVGE